MQRLTTTGSYAFAVAAMVACAVIRWLLNPLLENGGLYLAFMFPVATSAFLGGAGQDLHGTQLVYLNRISADGLEGFLSGIRRFYPSNDESSPPRVRHSIGMRHRIEAPR